MSAGSSNFGAGHLVGNVSLPRNINPQIRASIRREDPDANPEPHYTGLTGTTLNIDYSPTGALALNFVSDDLDAALTLINAADPTNLLGLEADGYLVLKNLNGGGKNYLEIVSGDAAPILGYVVAPEAGSKSYAGELSSASTGRFKGQDNPQGTVLIGGDEDLTSESLNRALAGSIMEAARVAHDLDVLVPGIKEFTGTVVTHAGSGKRVVYVQDANLRIPINGFGITGTTQSARELDAVVHIVSPTDEPLIDIDQVTERYARVLDVYAEAVATGSGALNNGASVAAFGTPDGGSIFGPTVEDLSVQGVTPISAVRGDLLVANAALFITNGVQPGDTAVVESSTNVSPFNHDGEYIITEVLTEAIVAVRAKSVFEKSFVSTEKPSALNKDLPGGTSYGTVRVLVGDYFSAKNGVAFEVPSWVPAATAVKVRCVSGSRMRNTTLGDFIRALAPNQGSLLKEFKDHIVDAVAGRRHAAADVDSSAIAGSPDSLSAGTVASQLAELLNHTNSLIAGQVTYGGGAAWADGTANPSTDLESQVDKILNDLVGAAGSAKLSSAAGPAWADGTTNPAERLDQRIDSIVTDLAVGAGSAKLASAAGSNWADGTTNPAERLDQRIDSIITDLAVGAGAAKLSAASGPAWADGTTNPSERLDLRLASIINDLATGAGTAKILSAAGPAWRDAVANPAERLDQRLDSIINDLSAATGAIKVGLPAGPAWHADSGLTNPANSVQGRIDAMITALAASTGSQMLGGLAHSWLNAGSIDDQLLQIATKAYGLRTYDLPLGAGQSFEMQNDGGTGNAWTYGDGSSHADIVAWSQTRDAAQLGNVLNFDLPSSTTGIDSLQAIYAIGTNTLSATVVVRVLEQPMNGVARSIIGTITAQMDDWTGTPILLTLPSHTYNFLLNKYTIQIYSTTGTGLTRLYKLLAIMLP